MKIVSNKPTITRRELEGVLDCLIHDELDTGGPVKTFEQTMSEMTGLKFALATNSITAAYHLIFQALQIDADSEVIMPSFSNMAPYNALSILGGKPVLVDNDENSLFPSSAQIKACITEKTKAIIIGHTFGFHFPLEELADLTIPIIEDISHAIGTENNEHPVGSTPSFAIISFAPSMIITTGNGGMVLTNNTKYFSTMRDFRGNSETTVNYEYAMTDIQGAMGISQMMKLKEFLRRRREIARKYSDALRITSHKAPMPFNEGFAYQSFPVLFDSSGEKVVKYWKKNGIETIRPIETPLHTLMGYRGLDYPNSDRLSKKLYTIPLYPTLTKKEIERIARLLASFI